MPLRFELRDLLLGLDLGRSELLVEVLARLVGLHLSLRKGPAGLFVSLHRLSLELFGLLLEAARPVLCLGDDHLGLGSRLRLGGGLCFAQTVELTLEVTYLTPQPIYVRPTLGQVALERCSLPFGLVANTACFFALGFSLAKQLGGTLLRSSDDRCGVFVGTPTGLFGIRFSLCAQRFDPLLGVL